MDLTKILDATAYAPGIGVLAEKPSTTTTTPSSAPSRPTKPTFTPSHSEPEDDPLPYLDLKSPSTKPRAKEPEPLLTLDDEPTEAPDQPQAAPPFRTPVSVASDSANLFIGPCEAVLTPHGLFLESVPYHPFLYAAVLTPIEFTGGRQLTLMLEDGRAVTIEFHGPNARRIAEDTAAFLAGERPVPDAADYRRTSKWVLLLAVIFAIGLGVGPIVFAENAGIDRPLGWQIGVGFAVAGLLANAVVVLFTRMPVAAKVVVMVIISALVTGDALLIGAAYVIGRKHGIESVPPQPPPEPPKPPELPPTPSPPRPRLPSAVDLAYRTGVYQFPDGPDIVTAVRLTSDGTVMLIGYENGETRVWLFDHIPDVDPLERGPRADGPITYITFDRTNAISYLTCTGGTVAAYWSDPPNRPLKIPAQHFAAFTFPGGERFAALRGNKLDLRHLPIGLLKDQPEPKPTKGRARTKPGAFRVLQPEQEVQPADVMNQLRAVPRPAFFTWHPTGNLIAGLPNGGIVSWGERGPTFDVITRNHKASVKVWTAATLTWDFATADAAGTVTLWETGDVAPTQSFTAAKTTAGGPIPIAHLALSPCGVYLAVVDAANVVWVWDLTEMRVFIRTTRPNPIRAVSFGPNDDLLILSDNKSLELWHLDELAKQP